MTQMKPRNPTFYWYDYETFGVDPRRNRPAQFAGRRTGLDFEPVSEGEVFYCRPSMDQLPSPESSLLTGITPQLCEEKGLKETEFARDVWERMNTPGTVSIGYNTLGFDDEVNRFLFWRNFLDAYQHSWANGCSRWDLFPVVCAAWALRGDAIKWPKWEEIDPAVYPKAAGRSGVCFKLEFLTIANGIEHGHAHDALSDVEATIGLARLLAEKEPRLWQWAFENRTKEKVLAAIGDTKPVVWVTPRFGIARGCTGIAACFYQDKNDCWMWDLMEDPTILRTLSLDDFRKRAFPTAEDRAAGVARLPIRQLKANASPFVCSNLRVLSRDRAAQYGIDFEVVQQNLAKLQEIIPLIQTVFAEVLGMRFADEKLEVHPDPDTSLYSSGFASANDKVQFAKIRESTPQDLKKLSESGALHFDDPQFIEMLLRYRARNWPETLSSEDAAHWKALCRRRLMEGEDRALTVSRYFEEIDRAQESGQFDDEMHQEILGALYEWGERLGEFASED